MFCESAHLLPTRHHELTEILRIDNLTERDASITYEPSQMIVHLIKHSEQLQRRAAPKAVARVWHLCMQR